MEAGGNRILTGYVIWLTFFLWWKVGQGVSCIMWYHQLGHHVDVKRPEWANLLGKRAGWVMENLGIDKLHSWSPPEPRQRTLQTWPPLHEPAPPPHLLGALDLATLSRSRAPSSHRLHTLRNTFPSGACQYSSSGRWRIVSCRATEPSPVTKVCRGSNPFMEAPFSERNVHTTNFRGGPIAKKPSTRFFQGSASVSSRVPPKQGCRAHWPSLSQGPVEVRKSAFCARDRNQHCVSVNLVLHLQERAKVVSRPAQAGEGLTSSSLPRLPTMPRPAWSSHPELPTHGPQPYSLVAPYCS